MKHPIDELGPDWLLHAGQRLVLDGDRAAHRGDAGKAKGWRMVGYTLIERSHTLRREGAK